MSFLLPWEDVLRDLQRNVSDEDLLGIPRSKDSLQYFLRVHLKVQGVDLEEHLKQLHVRPYVLLHLLHVLVLSKHKVFDGKGSVEKTQSADGCCGPQRISRN